MDNQRLIFFIIFSFSILLLWDSWQKEFNSSQSNPQSAISVSSKNVFTPHPNNANFEKSPIVNVNTIDVLSSSKRIKVQTDLFLAEIDTVGGDIRHLELLQHHDTDDKKKNFVLYEDKGSNIYIAQSGLIGSGLPNHKSIYTTDALSYKLTDKQIKVKLTWSDSNGIIVDKIFTFYRSSYLVDISYDIHNNSKISFNPYAYYQFLRDAKAPQGDPKFISTYTGSAIYTDKDKFQKVDFSDIEKGKEKYSKLANDGWIAMLQHYFFSSWIPEGNVQREFYTKKNGDLYVVGLIVPISIIEPGKNVNTKMSLYAGPQEFDKISKLAPGLDLVVDYGMLTVIATPIFWVVLLINKTVQNWGISIILLTVLIKLVFYPLSAKSYRSMAAMRVIAPKLQKLKEQYGEDRQRLHQAMMELYKTEKINPLGGCLPVVVQMPVFIALYWVLLYSVEMRQAPFMGWINDLSAPDPYYVLPIIMGITMIIQTKLNPSPPDPIQAKVMMIMPVAFSVFFFFFPSGLVLYWLVNNVLSIAQQWHINRIVERSKPVKGHG